MHEEYAKLFETGQYGRLYLVSGEHARGRTFHIYILPKGEAAQPNGRNNRPLNADAVEVYGITGSHPGWDETYGWLHHGKWEQDFADMVETRRIGMAKRKVLAEELRAETEAAKAKRTAELLQAY
jgi:hypothetical protein